MGKRPEMLHIIPSDSAAGALRQALKDANRNEEVLAFLDDLSCGPIASTDPAERAAWWAQFGRGAGIEAHIRDFWARIHRSNEDIVVWYSRHSARELAFFLSWSDFRGEEPYQFLDVAGLCVQYARPDGAVVNTSPLSDVGTMAPGAFLSLINQVKSSSAENVESYGLKWRLLKAENSYFRVVSPESLISAPIDYFDGALLRQLKMQWRSISYVINCALGEIWEPYVQTGEIMLHSRIVALVECGKLQADGDPRDMFKCRVKLS